jgi:hypothetical protein
MLPSMLLVMARCGQRCKLLIRKDIPALVVPSCRPALVIVNTPNVV